MNYEGRKRSLEKGGQFFSALRDSHLLAWVKRKIWGLCMVFGTYTGHNSPDGLRFQIVKSTHHPRPWLVPRQGKFSASDCRKFVGTLNNGWQIFGSWHLDRRSDWVDWELWPIKVDVYSEVWGRVGFIVFNSRDDEICIRSTGSALWTHSGRKIPYSISLILKIKCSSPGSSTREICERRAGADGDNDGMPILYRNDTVGIQYDAELHKWGASFGGEW